jgi:D-lyxose ketol-isomerase
MKRSEINSAIRHALETFEKNHMRLPFFAYWTMEEWQRHSDEIGIVKAVGLGWDVTDFGAGDFSRTGSVLFTMRNGSLDNPKLGTPYAEKLILQRHATEQEIPLHYHVMKTEDIINRGGGILMMELYNSTPGGKPDRESEIALKMDGFVKKLPAGAVIEVAAGCSVTLEPGLFHRFWAKKGAGDLVVGEVSSVNDDKTDNIFFEAGSRFSKIDEDAPPAVPLCNEYEFFGGKEVRRPHNRI